jgi:hypothetical protein
MGMGMGVFCIVYGYGYGCILYCLWVWVYFVLFMGIGCLCMYKFIYLCGILDEVALKVLLKIEISNLIFLGVQKLLKLGIRVDDSAVLLLL